MLHSINHTSSSHKKISTKFSSGWLFRFKKRNKFKRFISHGESVYINVAKTVQEIPILRTKLSKYRLNDLWNANEFGLMYKSIPKSTNGPGRIPGKKKMKQGLIFLACANGDGTEKFPLFIFGNSHKPHCFNSKSGQELGFDYSSNAKAWMNQKLFKTWLLRFDSYIGQSQGPKVALLLGNATFHTIKNFFSHLSNVEIFSCRGIRPLVCSQWMLE